MIKIRAYFDGCTEPVNPGGAMGVGAIIYMDDEILDEYSDFEGPAKSNSNNVAEYMAFTHIVEYLVEQLTEDNRLPLKDIRIDIRGDSKLVIEQMCKRWRIKAGYYVAFAKEAMLKWEGLQRICFDLRIPLTLQWVPRNMNDKADELSKKKLIENNIEFRIQTQ